MNEAIRKWIDDHMDYILALYLLYRFYNRFYKRMIK